MNDLISSTWGISAERWITLNRNKSKLCHQFFTSGCIGGMDGGAVGPALSSQTKTIYKVIWPAKESSAHTQKIAVDAINRVICVQLITKAFRDLIADTIRFLAVQSSSAYATSPLAADVARTEVVLKDEWGQLAGHITSPDSSLRLPWIISTFTPKPRTEAMWMPQLILSISIQVVKRQLQDCVVRVPYDTKVKRKTIQMAEKFQPVSSDLTLKERKEARSLRSVDLSDAEIGNRRNALAHCLVLVKDVPNRYYDS
ncbi:hypothetical protein GQR58_024436 [Nymphon striatum]|nr:hypothetical protein GQR58_024436 [Nymphon striatum]